MTEQTGAVLPQSAPHFNVVNKQVSLLDCFTPPDDFRKIRKVQEYLSYKTGVNGVVSSLTVAQDTTNCAIFSFRLDNTLETYYDNVYSPEVQRLLALPSDGPRCSYRFMRAKTAQMSNRPTVNLRICVPQSAIIDLGRTFATIPLIDLLGPVLSNEFFNLLQDTETLNITL